MSVAWQGHAGLQTAALEAELVPALNHSRSVFQVVILEIVESEL
jgi:hypothetical protein